MRRLVLLVVGLGLLTVLTTGPAYAAPDSPHAVARWSMVPQAKDVDGDGFIDGDGGVPRSGPLSRQPSAATVGEGNRVAQPHERLIDGALSWYLPSDGFPVRLDACSSRGERFRWQVSGGGLATRTSPWTPLRRGDCDLTMRLPEGGYVATLEVATGRARDRQSTGITVHNVLVVALGDSYASGEGNPRNVRSWLRLGGPFTPYWDDDACRRSVRGAPAQAALALERTSPHTSVTLVDLACSGATVDAGILGAQRAAGQSASQVEQAAAILAGRPVDLILLSIGGNDVGFTSVLQACALNADCPLARPGAGPLAGYPTVQQGVQAQTAALAGDLDRIAACLGGPSCRLADGRAAPGVALAPEGRVLPTLYPDITRAADGSACSYLSIPAADFAWARATILDPAPSPTYPYLTTRGATVTLSVAQGSLNQQVAAAGRLPGWLPVGGTWSASADSATGHGICAGDQAWAFDYTGLAGFASASFHPNPAGQAVLGRAIAEGARAALRW
jgi:lysophospholipase L1-like esterase